MFELFKKKKKNVQQDKEREEQTHTTAMAGHWTYVNVMIRG